MIEEVLLLKTERKEYKEPFTRANSILQLAAKNGVKIELVSDKYYFDTNANEILLIIPNENSTRYTRVISTKTKRKK